MSFSRIKFNDVIQDICCKAYVYIILNKIIPCTGEVQPIKKAPLNLSPNYQFSFSQPSMTDCKSD